MINNSDTKGVSPKGGNGGTKMYKIEYWDNCNNILDTYFAVPQEMVDKLQCAIQKTIDENGPFENEEEEISIRIEIIKHEDFCLDIEGYYTINQRLYDIHLNDFYYV